MMEFVDARLDVEQFEQGSGLAFPYLRGNGIVLLDIEADDIDFLHGLFLQEGIWDSCLLDGGMMGQREMVRWIAMAEPGTRSYAWVIWDNAGNRMGLCRLQNAHFRHGSVGPSSVFLAPEYQRKGVGREVTKIYLRYAFEVLNLNRVETMVYSCNGPCLSLIRSLTKEEGVKRQAMRFRNKWIDVHLFAWLKEDQEEAT